jgi:uncharacterized protein (TIGR02265 family)
MSGHEVNQVKGIVVVATLRFLGERFGDEALRSLLAELEPADRAVLEEPLVSAWYPLPAVLRLMRVAHRRFGAQMPRIYREMGRASADYGFNTVYRVFFKLGSPQFIISRGSRVFSTYFRRGRLDVTEAGPGFSNAEMRDLEDAGPEYCERILGWITRTLELSGAKQSQVGHIRCVHRGDPVCRFEGTWT